MQHARRTMTIASAAAIALGLAACGTSAADPGSSESQAENPETPETLVFASIPSEESSEIAAEYEIVLAALEGELGVEIELQEATDYAAVIEALRAGQVDIAALGPFSYMTAADGGAGVVPVGGLADSEDEEPGYQSYGIVPAGSDITDIAGFAGKTICFVDPTSTSGYLYPSAGLLEADIDPESGVTPTFAGGHDASVLSVADGTCDAGFAYDDMVTKDLIESGQLEEGAVEVVWESPVIPVSPTAVSTKLPQELQDQIIEVFTTVINKPGLVEAGYCDDEESCELPEDAGWGYVAVDDALYDGIREVCDITQSAACVE